MKRALFSLALGLFFLLPAAAWDNHAQISYMALDREAWTKEKVSAETLEAFLSAEKLGLASLLAQIEAESIKDIAAYKACPPGLAFQATVPDSGIREAFFHAIRINPAMPLPLFIQLRAGAPRDARPDLRVTAADPYDNHLPNGPFKALKAGEAVLALEVLATASDEPDYGMDIGLFEDNKSSVSSLYGFGKQAFGNPALPYGSQAPFHMALVHEDPLIKAAASLTHVSLSDWRFRLYTGLSRYAFNSGHPYWGWRFAGWALHYVQDMGQPWHASLFPGRSAWSILKLFVAGSQSDQDNALVLLSNRHLLLEDYLYGAMAAWHGDASASILYAALEGKGAPATAYRKGFLYDLVSWRAFNQGRRLDSVLVSVFPTRYTSDPSYDFGVENVGASRTYDPWRDLRAADPKAAGELDAASAPVFAAVGAESRAYVSWVIQSRLPAPARRPPLDLRLPAYLAALVALVGSIIILVRGARRRRRAG
jgi:hypothetical protein